MAKNTKAEPGYTTELHIRLKSEERDILQNKANEFGLTLSQTARRIIFKKLDGSDIVIQEVSSKEAQLRTLQGVQAVKTTFKKISIDVGRLIAGYERSLEMKNHNGEPAVNTEQTIRTVGSIVINQIKLQNGINEIIRHFGGSEIHLASKPPVNTVVGKYVDSHPEESEKRNDSAKKPAAAPLLENNENNIIPQEFRHMFVATFDATLLADVETYMDGNYEKIRLQVRVDLYRNGRAQTKKLDAVDFASRYKKVMPFLKKDRLVMIIGDFDFTAGVYNGESSDAVGTVEIKTLTLPRTSQ